MKKYIIKCKRCNIVEEFTDNLPVDGKFTIYPGCESCGGKKAKCKNCGYICKAYLTK